MSDAVIHVGGQTIAVTISGNQGPKGDQGPGGTLGNNSGFTAGGPTIIKHDSAEVFSIRKADDGKVVRVNSLETYNGVGTATFGAPRIAFGNNAPSNDDSCLLICRALVGSALFSHAVRDESSFQSTGDSAYTSFDARPTIEVGTSKYNHAYSFQSRINFNASNGIDLISGFVSNQFVSAGTVDRLYHFHVQALNKTGSGAVTQQVGLYISPLTGDTATDYGIYVENNPSFLGGPLQINGVLSGVSDIVASGEIEASSLNSDGPIVSFKPSGGVVMCGTTGAANYAGIRAYDDETGVSKGLAIQPTGGQVLIGASVPSLGGALEVVGTAKATGKVYAAEGLGAGNTVTATTLGTLARKMEVYDASGSSLGFVPIYSSIS